VTPDIDESLLPFAGLEGLASVLQELALRKARAVLAKLARPGDECSGQQTDKPGYGRTTVLAADTVVYLDEVLGKPRDSAEAFAMLTKLGGRTHFVLSAVALIDFGAADGLLGRSAAAAATAAAAAAAVGLAAAATAAATTTREASYCETAQVTFADYSPDAIKKYIADEAPFDKAGAYAIQGGWGQQVVALTGELETVIGLPWQRLAKELGQRGFAIASVPC